jgi:hypothetical protein
MTNAKTHLLSRGLAQKLPQILSEGFCAEIFTTTHIDRYLANAKRRLCRGGAGKIYLCWYKPGYSEQRNTHCDIPLFRLRRRASTHGLNIETRAFSKSLVSRETIVKS